MKTVFIYTPKYLEFRPPKDHPWSPQRAEATYQLCNKLGLLNHPGISILEPSPIPEKSLYQFHTRSYVKMLKAANRGKFREEWLQYGIGTTECPVYEGVYDYHRLGAGGTMLGAQLLSQSEVDRVFNVTGGFHHAGKDFAAGFCYINDIVLAIKQLITTHKMVMYLDIDAHHGDQVQEAFYSTDKVLTISFHQDCHTLFPFEGGSEKEIGKGKGKGYCINVPMAPGTGDDEFLWAFQEIFEPAAQLYGPEVIVAVLGADALASDPLSNLELTNRSYSSATDLISKYASKLLALGGGGYSLEHAAQAWTLAWAVMNDLGCNEDDMVSFGGEFWGDGVCSLRGTPVYVPEKTKKKASAQLKKTVAWLKDNVLCLIN